PPARGPSIVAKPAGVFRPCTGPSGLAGTGRRGAALRIQRDPAKRLQAKGFWRMSTLDVLILPGDGIGPEVTAEGIKILQRVCQLGGITLAIEEGAFGGASIDQH